VSGSTATEPDGSIAHIGNAAAQARMAIEVIATALAGVGARLDDVIRTRIYVVDISQWEAIGRVHGEVFGTIRPATSMIEVSRLIHPDMLVEIEADAVVIETR
jgi:enamine deaminase RidA (YjgF/YER057c/UK114 family)